MKNLELGSVSTYCNCVRWRRESTADQQQTTTGEKPQPLTPVRKWHAAPPPERRAGNGRLGVAPPPHAADGGQGRSRPQETVLLKIRKQRSQNKNRPKHVCITNGFFRGRDHFHIFTFQEEGSYPAVPAVLVRRSGSLRTRLF